MTAVKTPVVRQIPHPPEAASAPARGTRRAGDAPPLARLYLELVGLLYDECAYEIDCASLP